MFFSIMLFALHKTSAADIFIKSIVERVVLKTVITIAAGTFFPEASAITNLSFPSPKSKKS